MKKLIILISISSLLFNQDNGIDPVFTGVFGSATINDKVPETYTVLINQFDINQEAFFQWLLDNDIEYDVEQLS